MGGRESLWLWFLYSSVYVLYIKQLLEKDIDGWWLGYFPGIVGLYHLRQRRYLTLVQLTVLSTELFCKGERKHH